MTELVRLRRSAPARPCPWGGTQAARTPLWTAAPARFRRQNLSDWHKQLAHLP